MLLSLTLNIRSLLMFIAIFVLSSTLKSAILLNALYNTHPLNAHKDESSVLPIEKNTSDATTPILKNIYLIFKTL
jgi:hypothetical protein